MTGRGFRVGLRPNLGTPRLANLEGLRWRWLLLKCFLAPRRSCILKRKPQAPFLARASRTNPKPTFLHVQTLKYIYSHKPKSPRNLGSTSQVQNPESLTLKPRCQTQNARTLHLQSDKPPIEPVCMEMPKRLLDRKC